MCVQSMLITQVCNVIHGEVGGGVPCATRVHVLYTVCLYIVNSGEFPWEIPGERTRHLGFGGSPLVFVSLCQLHDPIS